jgi:DNA-binding NarL/FixJ family response regulator
LVVTRGVSPAGVAPQPGGERDAKIHSLSALDARELEVLRLLSLGLTNRQIADQICYSVGTVKNVVQCVIGKLGVSDRAQAADAVRIYLINTSQS